MPGIFLTTFSSSISKQFAEILVELPFLMAFQQCFANHANDEICFDIATQPASHIRRIFAIQFRMHNVSRFNYIFLKRVDAY